MNYVDDMQADPDAFPKPYWSNTSSNSIVRELIERADKSVRKEIEDLSAGRSDLILKEGIFQGRGIVIEQKVAGEIGEMEGKCREALEQIEQEDYEQLLREEGYSEILKYGICFFKKGCMVRKAP